MKKVSGYIVGGKFFEEEEKALIFKQATEIAAAVGMTWTSEIEVIQKLLSYGYVVENKHD